MALTIATLGRAFPEIFDGDDQTFSYGNIGKMVHVYDSYNADAYKFDETFSSANTASSVYDCANGEFSLFYRVEKSTDQGGGYNFVKIDNYKTPIASSCEVYLKKKNGEYVRIYDLIHVDLMPDEPWNLDPAKNKFTIVDSGLRIGGIMCAMASMRKKFLLLRIADVQALNAEQEKSLAAYEAINAVANDLRSVDWDETDQKKWEAWDMPLESIAFLVERGLLDSRVDFGMVTTERLDAIRKYIANRSDIAIMKSAEKAASEMKFNRTQVMLLSDSVRSHSDTVSGEISNVTAMVQYEMQNMQQDLSAATNLLARAESLHNELNSKIR
jgi:hypothetical protein